MVKNARHMMLATNALIDDLLNCESEAFIDMILTHIRDAIPFEEEDIMQWDEKEDLYINGCY